MASTSRQLDILTDKRARQIHQYRHVASRRVVERLVSQRIGTLIIDKNDGWKHAIGLRKRTNQNVVLAPPARFIAMLQSKAELVDIPVVVSEESSTSEASILDGDPLPVYDPAYPTPVFSGRRLNMDVNGAYNILRKGVPNAFGNGIGGVVVHPVRMTRANGPHGSNVHVA
jgi:IS605 OrfB family transposase